MMSEATVEASDKNSKKKPDDAAATENVKELKLADLRVLDLKTQLENRGLDKTGVKAALVERLKKALEDEGKEPDEYLFDVPSDGTTPKKSKKTKGSTNESKTESDVDGVENEADSEEEHDSENAEILQLSLDDKENHLNDLKESTDAQSKVSDNEDMDVKLEPSKEVPMEQDEEKEESDNLDIGKGEETATDDKLKETIDKESEEETKNEESETTSAVAVSAATKLKLGGKNLVKVIGKAEKASPMTLAPRNLWITGLASSTRAADLKALFSKQGKVVSVKIVTNAKQVSGDKKYYGYITMSTTKDALKCIQSLNHTELNGQTITVEKTQHQPGTLLRRTEGKTVAGKKLKPLTEAKKAAVASAASKLKKDATEAKEGKVAGSEENQEKEAKDVKRADHSRSREKDREHRSREPRDYRDYRRAPFRRPFGFRGRGRGRGGFMFRGDRPAVDNFRRPFGRKPFFNRVSYRPPLKPGFLTFQKIREERMNQRDHFREREIRESERRRAQDAFRHKLIERKQREEAYRLDREKVQLRIEREMLERERAEILKLEREKQRMERERLEREKEKLRRQTQIRDSGKRPFSRNATESDPLWEEKKRVARHYEGRYSGYHEKVPNVEGRSEFREQPSYSRHKFEPRSERFEREAHGASTSRSEFNKYGKDKADATLRDHDERRVYKRSYFKEESGRSYPPRETERYASPNDERNFKRKVHESIRSPRSRGGGRRLSYY